ncbi:MAG: hypothetical protein KDD15_00535 [Lewinella sp.]|nr:hypothetical protein [Lewinella sp.]
MRMRIFAGLSNRSTIPLVGYLALFTFVAWLACNPSNRKDIRDYYFPLKKLTDGLVYEYQPVGQDSLSPAFWYYRSFIQEDGIYLTGTYYEYDLIPLQLVREEMVSNGMLLQDLFLYLPDSNGRQERLAAEVLVGNVFPFSVGDSSGIFLYKVKFDLPNEMGRTTTLIKNRRYLGETKYEFQGETYDAIRFEVRELIEDVSVTEGSIEPQFDGEEIYALDLGLVYYKKNLGGQTIAYELADRYSMEQLEQTAKKRLNTIDQ